MSKFVIIDKDKKGNKGGEKYTITYQIDKNGPERYSVDMYCICENPVRYCYISGQYGVGLDTEKARVEFLDEFYEFQKGGSYRKTHPIMYKRSEIIKEKIKQQEDITYQLKKELEIAENEERHLKFKNYYDDVDIKSLNKYTNTIKEAISSSDKFYLSGIEFHIWEGHRIFIYDKNLQKPVKIITIRNGKIDIRDLEESDYNV